MRTFLAAAIAILTVAPVLAQPESSSMPADSGHSAYIAELLPRDIEIDLALSALPEHLRAEATVLALERGGLVEARTGTNGFVCMARQSGVFPGPFVNSMVPICYDRVGAETLVPAVLDEVRLLEQGMSAEQVTARIEAGWESGAYTPPTAGVAYMLSSAFRIGRPDGSRGSYIPHLMFYAPYLSNEGIGSNGNQFGYVPFMQVSGLPTSMMVLPVGEKERESINEAQADLRERAARWLHD